MTARENLFEWAREDQPEATNRLLNAYRAEVLREAADTVESLLVETPEYGKFVAEFLRGMAAEGGAR